MPNSPFIAPTPANPDIPEIDGVPCTGRNSGQCIGLAEDAAPNVQPESTRRQQPDGYGNSELRSRVHSPGRAKL